MSSELCGICDKFHFFSFHSRDMSQVGKVVLITGGAQGIGRSFTENLLAEGASVAICDVNKTVGKATVEELSKKYPGKVIYLHCDVTNDEQFEDCFRRTKESFSGIDIVINNAGIANERDEVWRKVVDINLVAVVRGTKLGFKYMSKEFGGRGGTIVNIASITALEPFPSIPVYSATKAAVNQFSRSYGSDLYYHRSSVKVLAINPGMTKTPLTTNLSGIFPDQVVEAQFFEHFSTFHFQEVGNMGRGLIEVLKKAQNGSLWTIEDDAPPKLTIIK